MMDNPRHIQRLRSKTTVELLWPYILSLCSDEPAYAYEIRDLISKRFGFSVGNVTAYMVLYKMEGSGLVSTEWRKVENRQRKYYSITLEGKKALKEAVAIFSDISSSLTP